MDCSNVEIRVLRSDDVSPKDIGSLGYATPAEALAAGERTCYAGNRFTAYLPDTRGAETRNTVCVKDDGLYYPVFFDVQSPTGAIVRGTREGSVGQMVPGSAIAVVDPTTNAILPQ